MGMKFNSGNPSLVSLTRLLAGEVSTVAGDLYPEQEVKDAINLAYQELWELAKDGDVGWGRTLGYINAVAGDIKHDLPTDWDGKIISLAVELNGKDLSSDSSAQWTYLEPGDEEVHYRMYREGEITSPGFYFVRSTATTDNLIIVAPPSTSGTNAIEILYEAGYTAMSANASEPLIPDSHRRLIAHLAALSLRVQADLPSQELRSEIARMFPFYLERIHEVTRDDDYQIPTAGKIDRSFAIKTGMYQRG